MTIQEVDRMFMELPTSINAMRRDKFMGGFTHIRLYLCVSSMERCVVMGYYSGRKEKVIKGEGNPLVLVTESSLSQCIKKMHEMVQRLGLVDNELLIIDA